jgi:hypothetical protein
MNNLISPDILESAHIAREREIFLRAALQLLEQIQKTAPDTGQSPPPVINRVSRSLTIEQMNNNGSALIQSTNNINTGEAMKPSHRKRLQAYDVGSDVIRFGILKKASRGTGFPSMKRGWKNKIVELRFGSFEYEDEKSHTAWTVTGSSVTSNNNNSSNINNNNTNSHDSSHNSRKSIPLLAESCQCRPFKIRAPNGNCVFELTLYGGPRRLWIAPSEAERDLWVHSIRQAMIGCLGDILESGSNKKSWNDDYDDWGSGNSSPVKVHRRLSSYSDGPAAPFALDIAKFVTLQRSIHSITEREFYRQALTKMSQNNIDVVVPVFYIKVKYHIL